jgi:hypothetical protein
MQKDLEAVKRNTKTYSTNPAKPDKALYAGITFTVNQTGRYIFIGGGKG